MTGDPQAITTLILSEQPHSHLSNTLSFCTSPTLGFPGGTSGKELSCQCRRRMGRGFDPWVGEIPTLVFLHGESHEQRGMAGFTVHGVMKSRTRMKQLSTHALTLHLRPLTCRIQASSLLEKHTQDWAVRLFSGPAAPPCPAYCAPRAASFPSRPLCLCPCLSGACDPFAAFFISACFLMLHNSAQVLLPLGRPPWPSGPCFSSPSTLDNPQPSLALSARPICSTLAAVCPHQELRRPNP